MRIDPTTLLFHDLSDDEAKVLQDAGESIMLRGVSPHPMPGIINQWFEVGGFNHDRGLLVVSTVLPARIFYSLLLRKQDLSKEEKGALAGAASYFLNCWGGVNFTNEPVDPHAALLRSGLAKISDGK